MEKNPEALHFSSPEAEIAYLREKIANKDLELREKKVDFKLDDVVTAEISRYRDKLSKDVLDETLALSKADMDSIVLDLAPERHDKKIEELLSIIDTKGIKNAMSVLSEFKDPHLEDDFHRFLVQYVKKGFKAKELDVADKRIQRTQHDFVRSCVTRRC